MLRLASRQEVELSRRKAQLPVLLDELWERGWTIRSLAFRLDVTEEAVRVWVRGDSAPIIANFQALDSLVASGETPPERPDMWAEFDYWLILLKKSGWGDTQIYRRMGIGKRKFMRMRKHEGVAPNSAFIENLKVLLDQAKPPSSSVWRDVLLRILYRETGEDGIYRGGFEELAAISGYKVGSIKTYMYRLQKQGYIRRLNTVRGQNAEWRLLK